jgi:hypothetical protein
MGTARQPTPPETESRLILLPRWSPRAGNPADSERASVVRRATNALPEQRMRRWVQPSKIIRIQIMVRCTVSA